MLEIFTKELAERVARGAALLDKAVPEWYSKIDPETLDIESLDDCVLGQVFGSWSRGQRELDVWDQVPAHCGFDLTRDEYLSEAPLDTLFWDLRGEWIRVINERSAKERH